MREGQGNTPRQRADRSGGMDEGTDHHGVEDKASFQKQRSDDQRTAEMLFGSCRSHSVGMALPDSLWRTVRD